MVSFTLFVKRIVQTVRAILLGKGRPLRGTSVQLPILVVFKAVGNPLLEGSNPSVMPRGRMASVKDRLPVYCTLKCIERES